MSDNFDAVYAAVRSKLGYCDLGDIAERALRNSLHQIRGDLITQEFCIAAAEAQRPSVLFRAKLVGPDQGEWAAMYGDHVLGIGKSPDEAMRKFDENWTKKEK